MKIEDCFTKKTETILIEDDFHYTYTDDREEEYQLLASEISQETGIPKQFIYSSLYHSYLSHWHKVNQEWNYFKCGNDYYHFIRELLGEVISEYYGLDTIHYKIGELRQLDKVQYGVLSKNFFQKDITYKSAWDLGINLKKKLTIFEELWMICSNLEDYFTLSTDLKKLMIRDFYCSEGDRMSYNFFFQIKDSKIRLAPLYDYSLSFEDVHPIYKSEIGEINVNDKDCVKKIREDHIFQMLLQHLMKSNIEEFIHEVEDRHHILVPREDVYYFKKYDTDKKKMILSKKLVK